MTGTSAEKGIPRQCKDRVAWAAGTHIVVAVYPDLAAADAVRAPSGVVLFRALGLVIIYRKRGAVGVLDVLVWKMDERAGVGCFWGVGAGRLAEGVRVAVIGSKERIWKLVEGIAHARGRRYRD